MKGWIILTKKPPTQISPPKLSIHYAESWVDKKWARELAKGIRHGRFERVGNAYADELQFGYTPDAIHAVGIYYKKEHIRLFPHEFNWLEPDRMRDYIFGMEGENITTHEMVPGADADKMLLKVAEETDLKAIMESAILDGCNPFQAYAVMLAMDIEDVLAEFPDVGWFRCKPEFAAIYCYEEEMRE